MKKFLSAALIALVVTFAANVCAAYDYDNDSDYVFVTTGQQGSYYLSLKSIDVQEYNPPHYQIAGTFVHVYGLGDGRKERWFSVIKRYNWYTKETFGRDENGYWRKEEIGNRNDNGLGAGARERKMADALFRAAYGIDFYGY